MSALKTIRQCDLPKDAEIKNDMIVGVEIERARGFILSPTVRMKSCRQPFLNGYMNTANIGHIILALAELLGVNDDGDSADFLAEFKNTPCRIASTSEWGDIISEHTWIGHFMEDRWILAKDLVLFGMNIEADEEAQT